MNRTPRGNRLHIGLFGRRNTGKSSLLNALVRQDVAIVSEVAGTTTDPVEKPMELLPLGPVVFLDTAGIDDFGALGELRADRTRRAIDRTDLGILVFEADAWGDFEIALLDAFARRQIPAIVAMNKADRAAMPTAVLEELGRRQVPFVLTSALLETGLVELKDAILRHAPADFLAPPPLVGDLIQPGDVVVLVAPIDMEAPRGRLILPQVQAIRDLLDSDAVCIVVKERELATALRRLTGPPALVVTDSQAFLKVAADTPAEVRLTSFSILFARQKGDLVEFVRGAMRIDSLRPADRVLVHEACSHHPIADDIGRVKIPRWLEAYVGGKLDFVHRAGHAETEDLGTFRLVIHCGGCVQNRREMWTRIGHCREAGVPITNYGMTIAYTLGIFERALSPFPAALDAYRRAHSEGPARLPAPIATLAAIEGLTPMPR